MAVTAPLARLRAALQGPYPALPRPLDAASERWSSLRPRVRVVVAALAIAMSAVGVEVRVQAAEHRWGGPPIPVYVATDDLAVGAPLTGLRRVTLPPDAAPAAALTQPPSDAAVLALALPDGAVVTARHVDPRGPAAGLDDGLRAVPIPVEDGWLVAAGGWVDVWVLGTPEEPATLVARSRPVLEVRDDGHSPTALVALDRDAEVGPATAGLALGRLLLAHAPAPTHSSRTPIRPASTSDPQRGVD